jgi:Fe-S-cluster containining protein
MEDLPLVESGRIPVADLLTIRRGEMARDNVKQGLAPLAAEIVKVKGVPGRWTCCYFDAPSCGCDIYEHRPLECRALNCRDTRRIEAIYDTGRLTRRDLIGGITGLWELVEEHERRCSYATLKRLVDKGAKAGGLLEELRILEILRYDILVRQLAQSKGRLEAGMLDFVFGRSLADTIKMYGIRLAVKDSGYVLVPAA